jgi:hypothetical protein
MSHVSLENIGPPPRTVPLPLRCQIAYGGTFNQIGWVVLVFGSFAFWGFCFNSESVTFLTFRGPLATAGGTVTGSSNTGVSVGGGKGRKGTPVFANHFSFTAPDGSTVQGTSHATGRQLPAGTKVNVEYCVSNPGRCRIVGMRSRLFGHEAMLAAILPLAGLAMVLSGRRKGKRAARYLSDGLIGEGVLKSKTPTNTRVNKQVVYKLTFGFTADDGKEYEVSAKTHETEKFEDEHREKLIYDPADPARGILLDDLPGTFFVDSHGQLQPGSSRKALVAMFLPTLVVVGNLVYALSRL